MTAYILDTESNDLFGYPIEIGYMPFCLENGTVKISKSEILTKYFSCGEPISFEAMAVHHILEEDIDGQPSFTTFKLPEDTSYLIGHNIEYDLKAIQKCGINTSKIKPICTLAIARKLWPDTSHKLTALAYKFAEDKKKVRELMRNAHTASGDILLTAGILNKIIQHTGVKDLQGLYLLSETSAIPEVMPFGEHKGKYINDLPPSYISYLLKKEDISIGLRKALERAEK